MAFLGLFVTLFVSIPYVVVSEMVLPVSLEESTVPGSNETETIVPTNNTQPREHYLKNQTTPSPLSREIGKQSKDTTIEHAYTLELPVLTSNTVTEGHTIHESNKKREQEIKDINNLNHTDQVTSEMFNKSTTNHNNYNLNKANTLKENDEAALNTRTENIIDPRFVDSKGSTIKPEVTRQLQQNTDNFTSSSKYKSGKSGPKILRQTDKMVIKSQLGPMMLNNCTKVEECDKKPIKPIRTSRNTNINKDSINRTTRQAGKNSRNGTNEILPAESNEKFNLTDSKLEKNTWSVMVTLKTMLGLLGVLSCAAYIFYSVT